MRKLLLTVSLIAIFTAPAFAAEEVKDSKNDVIARVNGEEIKKAELADAMSALPAQVQQLPVQAIYAQLLEQMIAEKIVAEAGYKDGLESSDEVKAALKNAEKKLVADAYLKQEVKKSLSDDKLKAEYAKMKAAFKPEEEVHAAHILVKTEKEANEIIKALKGGADFAKLSSEKSQDKGAAKNGGDLGYFTKKDMVKPFADAAFKMKAGELSTKPVKTDFGYHVIKVIDKKMSEAASFEQVKPQIEQQVAQQMAMDKVKAMVAGAKVERFQLDGAPMKAPVKK